MNNSTYPNNRQEARITWPLTLTLTVPVSRDLWPWPRKCLYHVTFDLDRACITWPLTLTSEVPVSRDLWPWPCPYHVTFDLDLDHACITWPLTLTVPVSRDLWPWPWPCLYHVTFDLEFEHTLDARWPGDHRVQVWWRSGHLPARSDWSARIIYIVTRYIVAWQTYRQTDCITSLPLAGEVIIIIIEFVERRDDWRYRGAGVATLITHTLR